MKRERSGRDDVGGARRGREGGARVAVRQHARPDREQVSGGKYYLKKASVVDVLTPRTCTLQLEGGEC